MSQIVAYFVTRSVIDGKVAGDLKSINKSAENLFICGHVQNIQCVEVNKIIYIKAKCLPEMRKDRVYLLKVAIKSEESDIVYAECGCPAGMGPKGSCKHIAALAYALIDFCHKCLPEYRTSTEILQQWNRPRQRHVDIVPVDELGSRRRSLTSSVRSYGSGVVFDPRPTSLRDLNPLVALEKLRCDLLSLNQPCGLLNIIIPSVTMVDGKIDLKRNHGYYHQVQLQLYVVSDCCKWCDFCVYTTKDVAVERIYPDQEWVSYVCPQLDEYYFDNILPEVVAEQHKPSYVY